jgi:hypothetical protein
VNTKQAYPKSQACLESWSKKSWNVRPEIWARAADVAVFPDSLRALVTRSERVLIAAKAINILPKNA